MEHINPSIYNSALVNHIGDLPINTFRKINYEKWDTPFQQVKSFIDENNKRPSLRGGNDYEKRLCSWIYDQQGNYKHQRDGMKNESRRQQWKDFIEDDKYKQYFIDTEDQWNNYFQQVKSFMDENNKRPSSSSKNAYEKQLWSWSYDQQKNYKNQKYSMKDEPRRKQWKDFIEDEKYKQYFIDTKNQLNITSLQQVKSFMDENNKRPSRYSINDDEKRIGIWCGNNQQNYKSQKYGMKDESRRQIWKDFIEDDKYKQYFIDTEDRWNITSLQQLKSFIDENNKRPSSTSKNADEKRLGSWIRDQKKNYKNQKYSMKDEPRRQQWIDFIEDEKYKQYFIDTKNQLDITSLQQVKSFMDENNKRPSRYSINDDEKRLGVWFGNQQTNYKHQRNGMKNEPRRQQWENFIEDEKYKQYFIDTKNQLDFTSLQQVKSFMNENNKRPSSTSKNADEKRLGYWFNNQQKNYKNQKYSMKYESQRQIWNTFREDKKFKQYFIEVDDQWYITLQQVKCFIDENDKRPSRYSKNDDEKRLGHWFNNQQTNYKSQKTFIIDEWKGDLYQVCELFINENNKRVHDKSEKVDEKPSKIQKNENNKQCEKNGSRKLLWENFINDYL
jgi:hypothetical protein